MTSEFPSRGKTRILGGTDPRSTAASIRVAAAIRRLTAERPRRVGVAVSGGSDSMALLALAAQVVPRERLVVLHVDHRSRSGLSLVDSLFVSAQARRLGLSFAGAAVDPARVLRGGRPSEGRWREERLRLLAALARRLDLGAVLLAHHADDVAEGVCLAALRGAGLKGLSGPPRRRALPGCDALLLRPLLRHTKSELSAVRRCARLPHLEDESNADLRFARNRVRHVLLPALRRALGPDLDRRLTRLARAARVARRRRPSASDRLHAEIEELAGRPVRRRFSLALQAAHARGRSLVLEAAPGVRLRAGPQGIRRLVPDRPLPPPTLQVQPLDAGRVRERLATAERRSLREELDRRGRVWVDAAALRGPLRLEPAASDLLFRPLGASRPRRLRRLLRSRGLPGPRRRRPFLVRDDVGVVAVEGLGPAPRAAVAADTRLVLEVAFLRPLCGTRAGGGRAP